MRPITVDLKGNKITFQCDTCDEKVTKTVTGLDEKVFTDYECGDCLEAGSPSKVIKLGTQQRIEGYDHIQRAELLCMTCGSEWLKETSLLRKESQRRQRGRKLEIDIKPEEPKNEKRLSAKLEVA
jgi:hypothetical protein